MNEFILKILSRFGGYNRVRVVIGNSERFFNALSEGGIPVWSIISDGAEIYFNVRLSDMNELLMISRRFGSNVVISEKFGAEKLGDNLEKYKFFILLSVCLSAVVMWISLYVWDIGIYGAENINPQSILSFLYDSGYKTGMKKDDVDVGELELAIKSNFRDVTGVLAEIDGVRLCITLFESESFTEYDNHTPVDIIAVKDCVVDEIDVYIGTGKVTAGEEVKAGDVLISGRVDYVFKDEENFGLVHATGKTLSYEKVFCDNINVDMYVPKEDAKYVYERSFFLFGKYFTYQSGTSVEGCVPFYVKNLPISVGWLKIPILYDEIRWYNKTDCIPRSDGEIYEDIYEKAVSTLPATHSVRNLSYVIEESSPGIYEADVEIDCAVNIGTEREIF